MYIPCEAYDFWQNPWCIDIFVQCNAGGGEHKYLKDFRIVGIPGRDEAAEEDLDRELIIEGAEPFIERLAFPTAGISLHKNFIRLP